MDKIIFECFMIRIHHLWTTTTTITTISIILLKMSTFCEITPDYTKSHESSAKKNICMTACCWHECFTH